MIYYLLANNKQQCLVFARTRRNANFTGAYLREKGLSCAVIHSDKSQHLRTKTLQEFKNGEIQILVATDIAARGLDIEQLPLVINYDIPRNAEDYVHRIGRTGRAGCEGEAMSLVCIDEHKLLRDIERLIKRKLPTKTIPGFEPNPSIKAEPIQKPRSARGGSGPKTKSHESSGNPYPKKSPGSRGKNFSSKQRRGHSDRKGPGQGFRRRAK
ncbi:hypothetical protein COB11_03830 [Candidatus Aerophobetes bacterium]|uniref:Helicase C-terminal domain-containing protein n=1 Tax=Aerophobetes bacterium TaxID=2030807 RepID=A0A2A4YIV0_UNCAE|nr:MAG: hypothetical protein COB11_03830 [Candidatus Aerophobetes bacterium]